MNSTQIPSPCCTSKLILSGSGDLARREEGDHHAPQIVAYQEVVVRPVCREPAPLDQAVTEFVIPKDIDAP